MTDLQLLSPTPTPVLRPQRRDGSRVVVYLDDRGATVSADVPVEDYKRMSLSVRSEVDGRPHLETWCNRAGRVQVPVTLLDLNGQPVPPLLAQADDLLVA
ncbi:MAG: hypothetical protein Q7T55_21870 [Solirubrobacteraceae bacterium]|nr:hypothetical protein [Solirubrobacteraceae bacterium]